MNIAIILAGGAGKRMNQRINKLLMLLDGQPIIYHTLKSFEESKLIDKIILVSNKDDLCEIDAIVKKNNFHKVIIVPGGEMRQDSVYNGIKAIPETDNEDMVLIHNAANPIISEKIISDSIENAEKYGACAVGVKARDTIKEASEDGFVSNTLNRNKLWCMQTPQTIKYGILLEAFKKAYADRFYGTDDVQLVERMGKKVKIVECSRENFKITEPRDLENAKLLLNASRVGIGQDSHKFVSCDKPLVLGGVVVSEEPGLDAHSDGDVILHALFNAISSAIGGKSLGYYADPMCKQGITDSSEYLKVVLKMMVDKNLKINNIALMIECKKPRLSSYEDRIIENIARLCSIVKGNVGIAVTSGEELTVFGRGEGIQVFSVVSLIRV